MSRPALAKPTRNLRWSIEVDPNCGHDEFGGLEQQVEVVADVVVDLLLGRDDGDVLAIARLELLGDELDDPWISVSVTQAPCTRGMGLLAPIGREERVALDR